MIKMNGKHSQLFGIIILALVVWSSVAHADPAGDVALGREALLREDIPVAEKLFKKAAEQNYLPAQVEIGDLLHAQQELEESFGWYMMAAYQGDAAASFNMGQMFAAGEGVEKNLEKALYWIKFAAGKNYLPAQEVLITAYAEGGIGVKQDPEQAKNWETKAIALRAAQKKIIDQQFAASKAARKAANEAAAKEAAETKAAVKNAGDAAAAKKVDDADK
jgi:TPR repeat protein